MVLRTFHDLFRTLHDLKVRSFERLGNCTKLNRFVDSGPEVGYHLAA